MKITLQSSYADHVPNPALGRHYRVHFNRLGGEIGDPELELLQGTGASTDQGNISHEIPSLSAGFWIRSIKGKGEGEHEGEGKSEQGGGPHTPDFEVAARTQEAHGLALRVGKALAATAVDILTVEGFLDEVKEEFRKGKTGPGR